MEPVLTNHWRTTCAPAGGPMNELITHTLFDETKLRIAYRRVLRKTLLLHLVMCVLSFGMGIRHTIRDHELFRENVVLLLLVLLLYGLGAFYLWRLLTLVKRSVTQSIDREEEKWHVRSFDTTIRFADTEFIDKNDVGNDENHYDYAVVARLVPCKNLILLHTKAKQFLMIDRTRFENGTEADFWKLMNEKCPDAVPRKHRA